MTEIPTTEQTKTFSSIGLVCFSEEEAQATVRAFNAVLGFIVGQGIDVHFRSPLTITSDYDHEHMKERFYVKFRAALLPANNMTGQQIMHPLPEVKIGETFLRSYEAKAYGPPFWGKK